MLEPSRTPLEYVTLNLIFDTTVDAIIRRAIPKVRRIRIIYAFLQNEQSFKSPGVQTCVHASVRSFDFSIERSLSITDSQNILSPHTTTVPRRKSDGIYNAITP